MTTLFTPVILDWKYWKWALKQVFFLSDFLLYHYSDLWHYRSLLYYEKIFKNNWKKIRINWEQYTLKIMIIWRTASQMSNFTGSYECSGNMWTVSCPSQYFYNLLVFADFSWNPRLFKFSGLRACVIILRKPLVNYLPLWSS